MYHVYKNGYSTLPNLKKISPEEVFEKNTFESEKIQIEKKDSLENQRCFFEHNVDEEMYNISADFILKYYPRPLISKNYHDIIKEADEDFLIHRIDKEKDYLCSAHVCFASHWLPENKIGLSFEEIHKPVPMNLKNSSKLIHAAVHGGIFERFVWSVIHEERYNFHPRLSYKEFDKNDPKILIKVERQVTVGFPEKNFCLFVLRQYLIHEKDIDKNALVNAIEKMTVEQKAYKGLNNSVDLINHLKSKV